MVGVASVGSAVVEETASALIHMMLKGQLTPGQRLRQEELAARLRVSRTPIREALQLLTADGMVTYQANRGYSVTAMSYADFQEVRRMRSVIEMQALTSIDWPDAERLQALRELNELHWEAGVAGNFEESALIHRRFHDSMLDLSRLRIVVREYHRMQTLSDLYRFRYIEDVDALNESRLDHERMIRALADHDLEALVHIRRAHSRSFESEVRRQTITAHETEARSAAGTARTHDDAPTRVAWTSSR